LIKYLVLIAVIAVILWMVTGKARAAARRAREDAERPIQRPVEDMVRCAHCGVFLPRADSVESRGARFCSREHERLH
jgi:uncharacterized protein